VVDAPARLPPLVSSAALVELKVPEFRDAVVSIPIGATDRRQVVIALHGNFDRPEWQCEVWREITEAQSFVLCPRGIERGDAPRSLDRWTYGSLAATEKELLAALDALSEKFSDYVDLESVVVTGFSLGAILGKSIVVKHAAKFPRAVFIEGGYKGWSRALAKKYFDAGGERVLFGCGQSACLHAARQAARVLEAAGLEAALADGGKAGHTYDGTVQHAVAAQWASLTRARIQPNLRGKDAH
jgi:predicted esterase